VRLKLKVGQLLPCREVSDFAPPDVVVLGRIEAIPQPAPGTAMVLGTA